MCPGSPGSPRSSIAWRRRLIGDKETATPRSRRARARRPPDSPPPTINTAFNGAASDAQGEGGDHLMEQASTLGQRSSLVLEEGAGRDQRQRSQLVATWSGRWTAYSRS